ncbi:MAG TPA: hypothetical protein VMB79_12645 [Jatrophihabitans sp.]|nr:hypothetical protein [Jatrophihabitans sp.]
MASAAGKRRAPGGGVSPRRRFAIRLIAVCVLGVLIGAGWTMLQPARTRELTSFGAPVSNAGSLLSGTEQAMRALVHGQHGNVPADARCYYATGTDPEAGATDSAGGAAAAGAPGRAGTGGVGRGSPDPHPAAAIGDRMFCGPVRFVDGDPDRPFLTYDLVSTAGPDGRSRLSLADPHGVQLSADPRPDEALIRPDGEQPPARLDLAAPRPPAAIGDVLTTTSTLRTPLTPAPASAVMVGQLSGVRLVEYGFVDVYGWGDRARTAPAGYRLLAFAVAPVPGELAAANPDLAVRVDGHERGPLAMTSDYLVTAVPRHAHQVDLLLTDSGTTQSISLLTGRPAATNPAVTVRQHVRQQLGANRPVRVRLKTAAGTGELTGTLTVRQLSLSYWAADGSHCSQPDRAWLHVGAVLKLDGDRQAYGAEAGLLSVTLPGGTPQHSRNAAPDPASAVDDVVEVPASIGAGTLSFAGTVTTDKGTLTVVTPLTLPFRFPAG